MAAKKQSFSMERHVELMEYAAKLEAALRPFARMAESYRDDPAAFVVASKGGTIVSVYDLRDAAALLQR